MSDLNVIVGIGGVLLGLLFNYKNFRRTQDKDLKVDTTQDAEMKFKIDYISKGVDDIRLDIKATKGDVDTLKTCVARIDESCKSAHHRINGVEEKFK